MENTFQSSLMNKYRVTVTYTDELLAGTDFHAEAEVLKRIKANQLTGVVKVVNLTKPAPAPLPSKLKRRGLLRRRRADKPKEGSALFPEDNARE